jgi:hypothetical protein
VRADVPAYPGRVQQDRPPRPDEPPMVTRWDEFMAALDELWPALCVLGAVGGIFLIAFLAMGFAAISGMD